MLAETRRLRGPVDAHEARTRSGVEQGDRLRLGRRHHRTDNRSVAEGALDGVADRSAVLDQREGPADCHQVIQDGGPRDTERRRVQAQHGRPILGGRLADPWIRVPSAAELALVLADCADFDKTEPLVGGRPAGVASSVTERGQASVSSRSIRRRPMPRPWLSGDTTTRPSRAAVSPNGHHRPIPSVRPSPARARQQYVALLSRL